MTPFLLSLLCDPETGQALRLENARYDEEGHIIEGTLVSSRRTWPVRNGIPRFVDEKYESVRGFGDQWNFFNFTQFKQHWLDHTVKNTFGSTDAFRGKVVVDAGGGAGAQTLWMLEAGAKHVILMDLSHSIDDVVQRNLQPSGHRNYDVIQCSIDAPPIRENSIDGIVICHNVIQHTPDVERTAKALYRMVGKGEFVFNCYEKNVAGVLRKVRWAIYRGVLRRFIPRLPFPLRLGYARLMGVLRQIPLFGFALEKSGLAVMGEVPRDGAGLFGYLRKRYRATVLNTFDAYGAHRYQHHLTNDELRGLVARLQPEVRRVGNYESYFTARQPGCALRVEKG